MSNITSEQRDRLNELFPLCFVGANVIWPCHDLDIHGTCRRCRNTAKKFAFNYKKP